MDRITLRNILPNAFANAPHSGSEIWGCDLTFHKGKTYLLYASSGMGKSSLCHYLIGYRNDYSGSLLFDDKDIRNLTNCQWNNLRRSHISYLFQELRLFPELTALENVVLKNNLTNHLPNEQIEEMFATVGLSDKMHSLCGTLSFGQQQRVAAIRCLAQPFDFLLLDEPISHLDEENASAMFSMIVKEAQRQQAALIITSIGVRPNIEYDTTFLL